MAIQELEIQDIEGIYAGETFSRKVELRIDEELQDLSAYTLAVDIYTLSSSTTPRWTSAADAITADNSTIVIPASITEGMLGYYIIKVTFNIGGFITIRKAKFKVEI